MKFVINGRRVKVDSADTALRRKIEEVHLERSHPALLSARNLSHPLLVHSYAPPPPTLSLHQ